MNTILAPTDFSLEAENAVSYAAELAERMDTGLVLFNCFHLPIMTSSDAAMPVMTIDELKEISDQSLEKEKRKLLEKFPSLDVKSVSVPGFAVEEISHYAGKNKIDLIVMGITGAGKLTEKLIGSTSTSVVNQTQCPVLIIPRDARYQQLRNIMLACDLKEIVHPDCFNLLKKLVTRFHSGLTVLNIMKPGEELTPGKAANGIKLEHLLEEVQHTVHFAEGEDVVKELEGYIDRNNISMVTMVSRRHKFIDRLLHESNTKRMAFHTHIPLLAIHE